MNNNKYSRGSEWRIWDLHVHTPASLVQHYKVTELLDVWEKYIQDLENLPPDIKVIGVNDYLFIDGYKKVLEYKNAGRLQNIDLILPVLEFRLSQFCGHSVFKRINFHVIFSNDVDADIIQNQFLNALTANYKLTPEYSDCTWGGVITNDSLIALGKQIKASVPAEKLGGYNHDLIEGFNNLNLSYDDIIKILNNGAQYFRNKFLTAIGKTEWDAISWTDGSIADKKKIINSVDLIFTASEDIDKFHTGLKKLTESNVNNRLLDCSDAHYNIESIDKDRLGNCKTWIKADPTFEGLKQILYEYNDRVKVQDTNPEFDFEKAPFTEIKFNDNVDVFINESDNVTLQQMSLPLNNNLVSIIGGRGTGKSILIDYISSGLGKETKSNYTRSNAVSIKRKTSLKDNEQEFYFDQNPNIPFMYISQSQIKNIVGNSGEFTRNIRETIGVTEEYSIPHEYKLKAESYINEYFGIIKILNSGNTDSTAKKQIIDKEIKRYNDFIANITSQENKPKLEQYKQKIDNLEAKKSWYDRLEKRKESIIQFEHEVNSDLQRINDVIGKLDLNIPSIDVKETIDYIQDKVLPTISVLINQVQQEIFDTKKTFEGYTGDLTTLLENVNVYQKKVFELQQEKITIEEAEAKFERIKQLSFKELGNDIKSLINDYRDRIITQWNRFKTGHEDYNSQMKSLLEDILGTDDLNVTVNISFSCNRLYEFLLQKLDGRSYNGDKLKGILKIETLDDYYDFITQQDGKITTFDDSIDENLRSRLLELFFKNYTQFIAHEIVVTSHGKNISKLSHGQQGTIYLRIKLAANLFSETIIYDQPEDDLDNDFIMSDLVSIFRKIKKYRQIIIVSHNANLVVNADSEQIIIAKNTDGILSYESGSLENSYINQAICKILEGGRHAFLDRERKYQFIHYPVVS